ncbi:MAG: lytic transglycosylase domain-containing protein [Clostridia bacterium]|nr:lytic transglycosylase domain-containing protein [Clostridia bacterium]
MEVRIIIRIGCLFKTILVFLIMIIAFVGIINSTWFIKLFYPTPYKEIVDEASRNFALDPYLIYAVIKVESKFDEKIQSPRGARGLMQIMPETGRWISRELDYQNFHEDMLFDPEHNIMIGSWYLSYLLKQFDGNIILALAAYNGGETNVKKWLANGTWSGTFNDLGDIPFKETRNYVYKVFIDYNTYKDLYGQK